MGLVSAEEQAARRIVLQRIVTASLFMLLSPYSSGEIRIVAVAGTGNWRPSIPRGESTTTRKAFFAENSA
jgi:hypothetical protein